MRRAEATRDAVTARVRAREALSWDQEAALLGDAVLETWNDPLPDDEERRGEAVRALHGTAGGGRGAADDADGLPALLGGVGVGIGRPRQGGDRRGERAGPAAAVADAVADAVPVPRGDASARRAVATN